MNAGRFAGNTVVIAASAVDLTPEDEFKIRYLEINRLTSSSSSLVNTATVTAPGGFTDTNTGNNSATDTDTIIGAPGVRTADFWRNTTTLGTVTDPITRTASPGLLIGDFNRNGRTDTGEDTLFYSTTEALQILNAAPNPATTDVRNSLARNVVAAWMNHLAGNPIDTAATGDKDARYFLNEGIHWLQALTPDENADAKGDGSLTGFAIGAGTSYWTGPAITGAASLPTAYRGNTAVAYGIEPGSVISTALDNYNNGRSGADGLFFGGPA